MLRPGGSAQKQPPEVEGGHLAQLSTSYLLHDTLQQLLVYKEASSQLLITAWQQQLDFNVPISSQTGVCTHTVEEHDDYVNGD